MSMENGNPMERMGVFPSIMEPARQAAHKLLQGGLDSVELEGKPGFWVKPKGTVAQESVFHEFEYEGVHFVIVEVEELA